MPSSNEERYKMALEVIKALSDYDKLSFIQSAKAIAAKALDPEGTN